jgi:hypothetical protein
VFVILLSVSVFGLIYCRYRQVGHAADELRKSETRYRAIADKIMDFAYAIEVTADGRLRLEWPTTQ